VICSFLVFLPGTINAFVVAYLKSTDFRDGLALDTPHAGQRIIEKFRIEHRVGCYRDFSDLRFLLAIAAGVFMGPFRGLASGGCFLGRFPT
jgi:hypothetical protein